MENTALEEKTTPLHTDEYIQLTEGYYDQDFPGRTTAIDPGAYGILVYTEEEIETIFDISPIQTERCMDLLQSARENKRHFALVAGYPCVLGEKQFIRKKPISSIVPWEII